MLNITTFEQALKAAIPRFQKHWLNPEQNGAVSAPLHPPTFIVAGPGSGKTTVLALRVLKLIFVDSIHPKSILATTFTRKAAAELRSRILSWGFLILEHLRGSQGLTQSQTEWLLRLDINAVQIGTLDAIAGDVLADNKLAGQIPSATVEGLVAQGIMRTQGFFTGGHKNNVDLITFLNTYVPSWPGAGAFRVQLSESFNFAQRVHHDQIDLTAFAGSGKGQAVMRDIVNSYSQFLKDKHLADFATLEAQLLDRLRDGTLNTYLANLHAVLVDEYQDTNYLQEQIYFKLCESAKCSLTVVGDDDQSIYRFRGATVELFAGFEARITTALGVKWKPIRVNLVQNYRSTPRIVDFCNHFVQFDQDYQGARVPGKLSLVCAAQGASHTNIIPVLGMFRDTCENLGKDLAALLYAVFKGNGFEVSCKSDKYLIKGAQNGDLGDSVLLGRSVREYNSAEPPKERLPMILRRELETLGVPVFNPRGRSLFQIGSVRLLLGLVMQCLDHDSSIVNGIASIAPTSRNRMQAWRAEALAFANTNPNPGGLDKFIQGWRTRTPGPSMKQWPSEWPMLELIFTLVTWLPEFQDQPEGQVYLEAIARTIDQSSQFSAYGGRLLNGAGTHDQGSIRSVYRDLIIPIAQDEVDVDEEIMPHVPRTYFPMMTVHQAKGLEFPLVIVDVGSDYRTNHHTQAPGRFPKVGDSLHTLETLVAPFTPVGPARIARSELQRAWDDLRRLYYVSYSRPQNVLLLVGLTSQIGPKPKVRSVATGDLPDLSRQITITAAENYSTSVANPSVVLI